MMKKISIAYFGSSYFSGDLLQKIVSDKELKEIIDIRFVVTQPDRPVGRKQIVTPTPVKATALKNKLLVLEFNKLKLDENLKSKINNLDLCLLYAYGAIIPVDIIDLPHLGFWNIHPSLLPLYRGTSPIATPLLNGDKITGVTLMKMDFGIDHGPIIDQLSYTILNTDYRLDLETKLTEIGLQLFKKNLIKNMSSDYKNINFTEQDHKKATYTKKLNKQDGFIEISKLKGQISNNSIKLFNLFRGLSPWPGIWTTLPNGKRLKIIKIKRIDKKILVEKVQLEGKNEVDLKTFNKAYQIF